MTIKRTPRPRDPVQLGKLMVDIATGVVPDAVDDGKDAVAAQFGRQGGIKGGPARSEVMTAEQRSGISKKAASVRWKK